METNNDSVENCDNSYMPQNIINEKQNECNNNSLAAEDNFVSDSIEGCDSKVRVQDTSETCTVENDNLEESDNDEKIFLETIDITTEKSGGVMKQIIKPGESDECPGYGDRVIVHYTGWLLNNREKPTLFESSRKGDKCEFPLGKGMVIKGWDLGIATMKKGEVALFIIQPQYAYGEMGHPPTIPAYTPLLFEIELFGWKFEDLSPKKDSSILRKTLIKGEGANFPNDGSKIKVKLIGYLDENNFEDREVDFILGEGCNLYIPEGIEIALLRFKLNERSLIYLKDIFVNDIKLPQGVTRSDEASIKYDVTLLNFEKVKDIWEMNSDEKYEKALSSKEKGTSYFKEGNYKIALRQFKWIITCLEKEPGVSNESDKPRKPLLLSGYLNVALCHLKLENYIDAIKACDKALELDPNNEKALFRRGQARMIINDCVEALEDFEKLCLNNPENKAAKNSVILCQEKIKKQIQKDKNTYNNMFEIFVKQDEEKIKNTKTETGTWESEDREEENNGYSSLEQRLIDHSNSTLRDANIIEISNNSEV